MLLRAIAAKMQVPSAMMGDTELKYANMAEMQTSFAVNVLIPDANEFYQQFCDFLSRALGAPKIKVFIDKKQFPELASEQKAAQDAIRADVQAGIITPEQARLMLYPQLTPTPLDKFLS
jgi:phage portal protein BeeE